MKRPSLNIEIMAEEGCGGHTGKPEGQWVGDTERARSPSKLASSYGFAAFFQSLLMRHLHNVTIQSFFFFCLFPVRPFLLSCHKICLLLILKVMKDLNSNVVCKGFDCLSSTLLSSAIFLEKNCASLICL